MNTSLKFSRNIFRRLLHFKSSQSPLTSISKLNFSDSEHPGDKRLRNIVEKKIKFLKNRLAGNKLSAQLDELRKIVSSRGYEIISDIPGLSTVSLSRKTSDETINIDFEYRTVRELVFLQ